jgi:hypothetical protein
MFDRPTTPSASKLPSIYGCLVLVRPPLLITSATRLAGIPALFLLRSRPCSSPSSNKATRYLRATGLVYWPVLVKLSL